MRISRYFPFQHVRLSAAVLLLFFPGHGFCAETIQELDIPIERSEASIQKLQSGIKIHLGKLQVAGQQEFSLLDQIEDLDRTLSLQRVRLHVLQERLDSQQEILAIKLRDLEESRIRHRQVKEHLQVRLRSYYLLGKTGILDVSFSNKTLPELMLFNDSFLSLLSYDQALMEQYRQSIGQLTLATEAHNQESALLAEFIDAAVRQQKELDRNLTEKRELLHRVKSEKVLYEQALKEMKKAETELLHTLAGLQQQKMSMNRGFVLNKGMMPPPVGGKLVSRFGDNDSAGRGEENSAKGIFIDAEDGSLIKAVFAGRVLFAGYQRGYGNMVIIDHGLDYYTITARMENIAVKTGQQVRGGENIGRAGDIATLFEKGISFEIRQDILPLDPLEWITSDGLVFDKHDSG